MEPRTSKAIAARVDVGYHRRGNRLRRWRWWSGVALLGAAMLLPAWAAIEKNERIYEAGPVSTAHQLIANQCAACHTEQWKPALRISAFNDHLSSVPDPACTVCHAGPAHHRDQLAALTACSACHREHRGRDSLARVDDRYCTQCHDDLKTTHGPSAKYVKHIPHFATHPEFAIFRSPVSDTPSSEPRADQVAEWHDGQWRDRTTLRFNHKKHCGPEGLLRPDGSRRALNCEHCHQVDRASGYMQPIDHERHCAECHGNQLHFDETRFPLTKVAHAPADKVRGELLDRYASLALRQSELAQDLPLVEPERALPGTAAKLSDAGWKWVNDRIEMALDQLLNRKQLGCRYCHTSVQSTHDDVRDWTVADPQMPSRWLIHAEFRHDRHQLLTCSECHVDVVKSSETSDILLPKIEHCHQCHGSKASRGAARSDCVECHRYHHSEGKNMDGPLAADLSRIKPENARQPPSTGQRQGAGER